MTTPSSQATIRLPEDLLERLDETAGQEGLKRTTLILELLEQGLNARGLDRLMLTPSQIASLDQTAERWGMSRIAALERIVKERILREFVEERQRQAFSKNGKH